MALDDHDLDTFFDLIADMPDIEAIDELDARIDAIRNQRKTISDAPCRNSEREKLNVNEDRCRTKRAKLVFRIEQRKWSKAVRAVFGLEGLERCLEWIRASPEDEVKSTAQTTAKARKEHPHD